MDGFRDFRLTKTTKFTLMSEANAPETPSFDWYQAGDWALLEQGDVLPNCPVLVPPANLTESLLTAKQGDRFEIAQQVQFADLIVMSQSCDLFNDKIEQVLLCAHHPASEYSKNERSSIRREQRPSLHMIEKCELPCHDFERQIVDFRTIYTLPKDFVLAYAATLEKRVRLLPPYNSKVTGSH